jgi:hypothetical protein
VNPKIQKSGTKAVAASSLDRYPHYDSGRTYPSHPKRARLFSQLIVQPNPELAKLSPARARKRGPGLSAQILTEQNRSHLRLYTRGAIIMFETAVQEKRTAWGIIMGVVALGSATRRRIHAHHLIQPAESFQSAVASVQR